MKKVQSSFAVEYKSGRRKHHAKPNSIWGNMDLKSVARDVEISAMPFRPDSPLDAESKKEVSSPNVNRILPILTPPVAASKTAAEIQEIFMADDTDTTPMLMRQPLTKHQLRRRSSGNRALKKPLSKRWQRPQLAWTALVVGRSGVQRRG